MESFSDENFISLCDQLASLDQDLNLVIQQHGYPPLWTRAASFETLIHIILEQQVSLASALAALKKIKEKIVDITPENLLALSDAELKACYFSRQKIVYCRHLASEFIRGELNLDQLQSLGNDAVKSILTKIKGIGNWSTDVYLMMVLHRCDIFPLGDIALLTSVKEVKNLSTETGKETIALIAEKWKPYQSIAAYILWHAYLCKRNRQG
ncbi:DNA-3-methyladenine glycosylase 2 family protein [Ferruginibacter paludis]|uniref:DNA-3-methyladenine glycosylase family protein n=1 Tax=Ferruginibacter paludis TaxID=1310417 RepID=UPI0025B59899|nr:DNA-3-methyladenine glycosylase 2 family protein [Ferruginibacter paludis]MDN3658309.1 DNA-3-methyladenine glycosylase 2 family protein [Ferruginibacter paludis]